MDELAALIRRLHAAAFTAADAGMPVEQIHQVVDQGIEEALVYLEARRASQEDMRRWAA